MGRAPVGTRKCSARARALLTRTEARRILKPMKPSGRAAAPVWASPVRVRAWLLLLCSSPLLACAPAASSSTGPGHLSIRHVAPRPGRGAVPAGFLSPCAAPSWVAARLWQTRAPQAGGGGVRPLSPRPGLSRRLPPGARLSRDGAADAGRQPASGRGTHAWDARSLRVQSKSSIDGTTGEGSVARMAEAVQALEKAAGARSQAGAQGSEQETREAEDEVIRVLGLCARAAKLGTANARTAVDHALRAFETVRPASARALADASHAGTVWGSRRHVSWGSGRRRVTL